MANALDFYPFLSSFGFSFWIFFCFVLSLLLLVVFRNQVCVFWLLFHYFCLFVLFVCWGSLRVKWGGPKDHLTWPWTLTTIMFLVWCFSFFVSLCLFLILSSRDKTCLLVCWVSTLLSPQPFWTFFHQSWWLSFFLLYLLSVFLLFLLSLFLSSLLFFILFLSLLFLFLCLLLSFSVWYVFLVCWNNANITESKIT